MCIGVTLNLDKKNYFVCQRKKIYNKDHKGKQTAVPLGEILI